MVEKWRHLHEFVAPALVPPVYMTMTRLGLDSADAQVYSAAVGALYYAFSLWWRAQVPDVAARTDRMGWLRTVVTAALLVVLALVIESATAGLVLGVALQALDVAGAGLERAADVRAAANRYFAIPIGACFLLALGFWSAKVFPVRRPLLWFGGIVLVWYLIRLAMYAPGRQALLEQGVVLPTLGEAIFRVIPIALISYSALTAGNFLGRRRYGALTVGAEPE